VLGDGFWPGRAKRGVKLFAEKLLFAGIIEGTFRQHPYWQVMADTNRITNTD
jgi:hypothetical protein